MVDKATDRLAKTRVATDEHAQRASDVEYYGDLPSRSRYLTLADVRRALDLQLIAEANRQLAAWWEAEAPTQELIGVER